MWTSLSRNYQTSWTNSNDLHNLNFRLSNIRIGSKDRLNGSVGYQGSSGSSPNLFEFIDTSAGRSMNASLTWSRSITARLTTTCNSHSAEAANSLRRSSPMAITLPRSSGSRARLRTPSILARPT